MSIMLKKKNFAKSTLASGITDVATALTVATGEGSKFPSSGKFRAVLYGAAYSNPSDDPNAEVITMELSSGDTFDITRAQEGATAQAWSAGDNVAHALTAGTLEEIEDAVAVNELNVMLNAFRIAVNGSLSVKKMLDGIVDEFEDETGVDGAASTNEKYDAAGDFYTGVAPDSYTALLLHCNGDDASTYFPDYSSSGHTVTPYGNAQVDTAQSKFGGASLLLDGTGDYLIVPNHADFNFGAGDFTIDFWVRFNADEMSCFMGKSYDDNGNGWFWEYSATGSTLKFYVWDGSAWQGAGGTWDPSMNTWYHVAAVRNGNTLTVYIDGSVLGSTLDVTGYPDVGSNVDDVSIGTRYVAAQGGWDARTFNGWLDEIRISKGIARWTANFTPPTGEYSGVVQDMTLISVAAGAEAQPDSARIVLFEEDVDAVVDNTDLKAWASRDGGTTWTQITLADEGQYGATGQRILTGTADISAQPAGTSMKWKVTTHNTKELKVHGVSLSWA